MKFHVDGTLPTDRNTIFVFGSNLAGFHGGGAARIAEQQFGAEHGIGLGQIGNSYAIPTKDINVQTLPLERIAQFVAGFLSHVRYQAPDIQFFITRIGCGIAGYTDQDIAPMFKSAPANCSFANEWKPYVE